MEEDIEILEQLIEDYEMCREIVCVKDIEAIKNLINRVKELQEKNKLLQDGYDKRVLEIMDIERRVEELEEEK